MILLHFTIICTLHCHLCSVFLIGEVTALCSHMLLLTSSSPVQWRHICRLTLAVVGIFTPWKLVNTADQVLFCCLHLRHSMGINWPYGIYSENIILLLLPRSCMLSYTYFMSIKFITNYVNTHMHTHTNISAFSIFLESSLLSVCCLHTHHCL